MSTIGILEPEARKPYVTVIAGSDRSLGSVDAERVIELYKEHGALLFRGFELTVPGFSAFAERFCTGSAFNESPDRQLLDEQHNVQTVNLGPDPFPLHPEMSRDPWRPDVCFFGCMSAPSKGGQTVICDGQKIVENMPAEVFNAFEPRRLLHAQRATPEICEYWLGEREPDDALLRNPPESCPYEFFRLPDGTIGRSFSRPALYTPMFSDELTFANFLLFARYQLGVKSFPVFENRQQIPDALVAAVKEIADRLTVPVEWEQGDIVMLDNTRFMHGRNAILDTGERLILTYFGYLRFAEPGDEEPPNAPWRKPGFRPPYLVPVSR